MEYISLTDGSEEVLVRAMGRNMTLYQNLDGDNTIDRIRKEKFIAGWNTRLEDILIRRLNYQENKEEFDSADKLLLEERKRYKK